MPAGKNPPKMPLIDNPFKNLFANSGSGKILPLGIRKNLPILHTGSEPRRCFRVAVNSSTHFAPGSDGTPTGFPGH